MNLRKQKALAKRVFGIGKKRIIFSNSRIEDLKAALTKQDIRVLHEQGAIIIKGVEGRKKVGKRKRKRKTGKIKKTVKNRKKDYVIMVRKQRKYLNSKKAKGELNPKQIKDIRNKIRNKVFKNQVQLKDHIERINKK